MQAVGGQIRDPSRGNPGSSVFQHNHGVADQPRPQADDGAGDGADRRIDPPAGEKRLPSSPFEEPGQGTDDTPKNKNPA